MELELIDGKDDDPNDYEAYLEERGYTGLEPNLKEDIIAVLSFLCREDLVRKGLQKFAGEYFQFNTSGKKTMRRFFDDWGGKNGFNATGASEVPKGYTTSTAFQYPHHTPILFGALSPDLFLNVLLKNGYLSSDPGAGVGHGKWAHSVQIYLLEEARKDGTLNLKSPSVCDFVKTISQVPPVFESLPLWEVLFDSFEDSVYTCPNNITATLNRALDSSGAALQLASKFVAYKEKVSKMSKGAETYTNQKYLSRLSESSYITSGKYGIMWLKPKDSAVEKKQVPEAKGNGVTNTGNSLGNL
ncbi:LirA/MavJ family T4SS effector [Legionella spiritensis]|uniref:Helicase n=1 Tax=Legionella spiritensis TaxID=452 RepID=A0A0W0YW91_LEGSP|nr:LirA/MavJ family T4SS effector [Legionella spiritensis]KTD61099.1 helicase [Legionella spiritensis]SNV44886.1 helicase [Legionella spiritensis]